MYSKIKINLKKNQTSTSRMCVHYCIYLQDLRAKNKGQEPLKNFLQIDNNIGIIIMTIKFSMSWIISTIQALYVALKVKGRFLKKLNIELISIWSSNTSLRYIFPGEVKTCSNKNLYTNVHSSFIQKAKK